MIPKMGGSMFAKNSSSGGSMIPENHTLFWKYAFVYFGFIYAKCP